MSNDEVRMTHTAQFPLHTSSGTSQAVRAQICAEALTWLGTPFHHLACVKHVGVDCAMLLAGVGKAVGLVPPHWWPPPYAPEWHLHRTEPLLEQTIVGFGCQPVSLAARQPGDICLFQWPGGLVLSHAALLVAPDLLVHAILDDQVRQHSLRGRWRERLRACYAFPGINEE
jgi:NlpC/P60 family putative phage cell wall peptidase